MKIIIYTINNCAFCQQEKEYLQSHNLPFEEKNLDENHDYLTEMLALSNNFVGVPFTVIEKDNGEKISFKGYTKEEFDKDLGIVLEIPKPSEVSQTAAAEPPRVEPRPIPEAAPTFPVQPAPPASQQACLRRQAESSVSESVQPISVNPAVNPTNESLESENIAKPESTSQTVLEPLPDLPSAVNQPLSAVEPAVIPQSVVPSQQRQSAAVSESVKQTVADTTSPKASDTPLGKGAVDLNQDASLKEILDNLKALSEGLPAQAGKSKADSQTVDYQPKTSVSSEPPKIPDFPK